jgi:antitoxin FitA
MATTIWIRNVPDDVHAAVCARAAKEGLSVSEYLLRLITELSERPTATEV